MWTTRGVTLRPDRRLQQSDGRAPGGLAPAGRAGIPAVPHRATWLPWRGHVAFTSAVPGVVEGRRSTYRLAGRPGRGLGPGRHAPGRGRYAAPGQDGPVPRTAPCPAGHGSSAPPGPWRSPPTARLGLCRSPTVWAPVWSTRTVRRTSGPVGSASTSARCRPRGGTPRRTRDVPTWSAWAGLAFRPRTALTAATGGGRACSAAPWATYRPRVARSTRDGSTWSAGARLACRPRTGPVGSARGTSRVGVALACLLPFRPGRDGSVWSGGAGLACRPRTGTWSVWTATCRPGATVPEAPRGAAGTTHPDTASTWAGLACRPRAGLTCSTWITLASSPSGRGRPRTGSAGSRTGR